MAMSLPYFTPSDFPPSISPRPTITTTALLPGGSACQSSFFSIVTSDFPPPTGPAAAFTPGGGLSAFLSPTDCAALAAIPSSVSAEWSAYVVRAEEWIPRRQDAISSRIPQCPDFTTFMSRGGAAARQTCAAAAPTTGTSGGVSGPAITAPPTVPTPSRNITLPTPTLSPNNTATLPPNTSGRVSVSVSVALGMLIVLCAGAMM